MEDKLDKIIELLELLVIKDAPTVNVPSVWEDGAEYPVTITTTTHDDGWQIFAGTPAHLQAGNKIE